MFYTLWFDNELFTKRHHMVKAWFQDVAAAGPQGCHLHLGPHHEDAMGQPTDVFTAEGLLEEWGWMKNVGHCR